MISPALVPGTGASNIASCWTAVAAVSGDIGADIAVGTGKTVTWNAGIDWDQLVSSQTRFRVIADDGVPMPGHFLGSS